MLPFPIAADMAEREELGSNRLNVPQRSQGYRGGSGAQDRAAGLAGGLETNPELS
jgi:hypothetical protein